MAELRLSEVLPPCPNVGSSAEALLLSPTQLVPPEPNGAGEETGGSAVALVPGPSLTLEMKGGPPFLVMDRSNPASLVLRPET